MESIGSPRFFRYHQGSVRGVSFAPKDRYLFCSGSFDGTICLYHAGRCELLRTLHMVILGVAKNVNGVRFTNDGQRILAATTARRMSVLDTETGQQIITYNDCAFSGRERTPLATDPVCPHLAVCSCVNGKGLTLFDLRMPLPLDFVLDLHSNVIRDITFLHQSWPFVKSNQSALLSLSYEGVVKATTLDGRFLHCFEVGHHANSIAPTPEEYGSAVDDGFSSLMMVGGDFMSSYMPENGIQERHQFDLNSSIQTSSSSTTLSSTTTLSSPSSTSSPSAPPPSAAEGPKMFWKLKYSSNGSLLYTAGDGGVIRRYRRYPHHHHCLGELFRHKGDVQDMDISPYDEFLVTASKDKSVGLICLGAPNHGWTQYFELS